MNKLDDYIKLAESATEGPWYIEGPAMGFASIESERGIVFAVSNPSPEYGDPDMPDEEKQANLELCAASRTLGPAMAKALIEAEEILFNAEEYFDNCADADMDQDGYIPNKEMRLLIEVREALATIKKLKENEK